MADTSVNVSRILPPPHRAPGAVRWVRENLFKTWYNGLLTLLCLWLAYAVLSRFVPWVAQQANWSPIPANTRLFFVGTYPRAELWRVWLAVDTLALLAGLSAGLWGRAPWRLGAPAAVGVLLLALLPVDGPTRLWILSLAACMAGGILLGRGRPALRRWVAAGWMVSFPWHVLLLYGVKGSQLLPRVDTILWGGLLLTMVLAVVGIVACFPLGVLLALGRRSSLPAVSFVCTLYIEVLRGVPLISVLFMSQILLPLFVPDIRIDNVIRAMIGLTLFSAAYMAENVRGGLQGVGRGQYEAAYAVGLNGPLTLLLIVLPQALRSVIPAIVGQFIALFKDTSLVAIIGLLDLLGIARSILNNPRWLGLQPEVYLFVALIYGLCSYCMSYGSRRLERALGVGER